MKNYSTGVICFILGLIAGVLVTPVTTDTPVSAVQFRYPESKRVILTPLEKSWLAYGELIDSIEDLEMEKVEEMSEELEDLKRKYGF